MNANPLAADICDRIRKRKAHWDTQFGLMRKYQAFVRKGAPEDWDGIIVNVAMRHVRDWTSQLYARQPRTVFRRRKSIDFAVWNEDFASLQKAVETMARANPQVAMAAGMPPAQPNEVISARALLLDATQGMAKRETMTKIGKTAAILYDYFRDEQCFGSRQPMKRLIRRAMVTGVGYVAPAYQRVQERSPEWQRKMHDAKTKLDEVQRMMREAAEGDVLPDSPEAMELQQAIAALEMEQPMLREGLTLRFPASTAIIPDEHMTDIMEFEGCEEVAEEFVMTREAAEAAYGVKIDTYLPYTPAGRRQGKNAPDNMVVIWQNWNVRTGLVHTVCDGYPQFLTEDFQPPVWSETFWPWISFAPNPSDDPENPFPVPVIETIMDICHEMNRSIDSLSDARYANRPGTFGVTPIDDADAKKITNRKANEHLTLDIPADQLEGAILPFPTPPFNERLYDLAPLMGALEAATGVSEARLEASKRVSATAVSISEAGHGANVDSLRDELDDLNARLARMCGQILMRNMSEEKVREIVGKGALWPEMDMPQIAAEIHLEAEFGSSGLPNQAQRVASLRDLGQLLFQLPGVVPERMAKLLLEAIDQNIDLTDFFDPQQMLSIQSMNAATGRPVGGGGADNGPRPPAPSSQEPAVVA